MPTIETAGGPARGSGQGEARPPAPHDIERLIRQINDEKPTIEFDDAGEGDKGTRRRGMTLRKFSKISFRYIFISYIIFAVFVS